MIDGKARLISDLFCDGLGACIGECPVDAITIEEREAHPYDEARVMENIVQQGDNVVKAHLKHLQDHNETGYLNEAMAYLKQRGIQVADATSGTAATNTVHGCPGVQEKTILEREPADVSGTFQSSELANWPVQMHLIPPNAPLFRNADLLLAADCVAYASGSFHRDSLKGKRLVIACPKLDANQEIYVEKLVALIDTASIKSITVMTMEVPCCTGLLQLTKRAAANAQRKVPVQWTQISIRGDILHNEFLPID